jgi:hypothetical protein
MSSPAVFPGCLRVSPTPSPSENWTAWRQMRFSQFWIYHPPISGSASTARDFSCGDVSNPVGTENGRRSRHHHDQKGISVHDLFPDRLAPSQYAMRRFDSIGLGIARPRPELAGSGRLEIAFDLLLGMPPLFPTTQVHAKRIATAGKAGRSRGIIA